MPEERKLVTVLFADVAGSTSLGDGLDPEDVRALMGRYYAHARRVVADYAGTIEKFIGDAVVAVFGLPQVHGDDAERALAAALALRAAVADDTVLGPPFQLRMGVNTGEVIAASDLSHGDFLVSGDTVNVAARLEQHAAPGEIVAGERTHEAVRFAFDFAPAREIEAKGKPLPLRVYPLIGARTVRVVARPPLVGRKQDLVELMLLHDRTLQERRPQFVTIVAPAGTGKTRLLEEFLARLDPAGGFQIATARCLPYGQTLAYWPLRGLLADLLGAAADRARLTAVFTAGGYSQDDSSRLAGLVLATLGVEGERATDRESIFAAWRLLMEVLAARAPRIVVFEDLHWASDSLLDLVEHIIHVRTSASLMLIALGRPELLDRRPVWGSGRHNFTAVVLQPLAPAQTHELVAHLSAGLPEAAREEIVERSGGNPFFALELARGVAERAQPDGSAARVALPDTVHAAVLARLDALAPVKRSVLQVASVASRTFHAAMLHTVLDDHSPQEIDAALDDLLARDLILSTEIGSFAFRHILIRDVAYGTLARPERIRLHTRIAAWLEAANTARLDEYAGHIAYHYREAVILARQSAVPLLLTDEPERAVHYLARAGKLASRAGAMAEAASHLRSAIEIAPESDHTRLYELLGDTVLWGVWGDIPYTAYRSALEAWRRAGAADSLTAARLLRKIVAICTRSFVIDNPGSGELAALLAEADMLAQEQGDEDEQWRRRVVGIFLRCKFDRLDPATLERLQMDSLAAAAHFEARGDWVSFSEALDAYTAIGFNTFPRDRRAYGDILTAIRRRLAAPDLSLRERGDALGMLAVTCVMMSDLDGCVEEARRQINRLRPGEPIIHLEALVSQACMVAFMSGRWHDLDDLLRTLATIWEQLQYDASAGHGVADGYIAALLVALAREDRTSADAAYALLTRIMAGSTESGRAVLAAVRDGDPARLIHVLQANATGPLLLGTDEESGAVLSLMVCNEYGVVAPKGMIERVGRSAWHADMFKHYLAIAAALAAGDDARLAAAVDAAETDSLVVHAARLRIVLAQRTGDRTQLDRARPALERVGDRQFLGRLDEVAVRLG